MLIHDESQWDLRAEDFFATPFNSFSFFLEYGNILSPLSVIIYVGTKEVIDMAKTYKIGLVFTFEPEGEHADIFEEMNKTEGELIAYMKNLVCEDIDRYVKYNEVFEGLSVEIIEE
jgi:hypothetical protein